MYKFKNLFITIAVLVLFSFITEATAASTTNFPFPRSVESPYGIRPADLPAGLKGLQRNFEEWVDTFYVEGSCNGVACARIRFDDRDYTVSEGIGYGMLLMVYMDNATNDTRAKFDKLWAYYNAFLDGHGLMNWKVEGFIGEAGYGAATDAELDVALALMMAYKQWGDDSYLNAAGKLVDSIYTYEVDENGYLKPGDTWNTAKNPSYQSTAAMRLFDSLPGQNGRWAKVVENAYRMLLRNTSSENSTVGLPSDWCDTNGTPVIGTAEAAGNFGYESVRTPWRMSTAYSWFGDTAARNISGKIAAFAMNDKYSIAGNVANLLDGYKLSDGSVFISAQYKPVYTALFVGAFGVAGTVDEAYRTWMEACYDTLFTSRTGEWYYDKILQVMFGLAISGEFDNFWSSSFIAGIQPRTPGFSGITITSDGDGFRIAARENSFSVQILDLKGKAVKAVRTENGKTFLSGSGMPRGAYILQVKTAAGAAFQKLVSVR